MLETDTDTRPRIIFDDSSLLNVDAPPAPTPEEVVDELTEDAEAKALLAKAKLDHVPTIDEAKELLAARRAEIRHAVMLQADKRDWCEDGTRKVCANLRLERPGSRTERVIEVEMTVKLTVPAVAYTDEGALHKLKANGVLSPKWIEGHLYVRNAVIRDVSAVLDGKPLDVSTLTEKKPEVTA